MKIKELRELNTADLVQKEKSLKKELFDLNFKRKFGQVEKPAQFQLTKKTIAKINTIIREREIKEESGKHGTKK